MSEEQRQKCNWSGCQTVQDKIRSVRPCQTVSENILHFNDGQPIHRERLPFTTNKLSFKLPKKVPVIFYHGFFNVQKRQVL